MATRPTGASVDAYLDAVEPPRRREDGRAAVALMREATGAEPVLWGTSMIGFGERDGWFVVGLAPRRASLVLYGIMPPEGECALPEDLGPHTAGKGCLYVADLGGLDAAALRGLIEKAWRATPRPG